MLVRTWNVFHGNTVPAQRRAFVADAVRLAVAGGPDVVCLQELPAWSLARLGGWSGYTAVPILAARPMLGPLPSTAEVGRVLTSLNAGLLRSAFAGQGNAILVSPRLELRERFHCVLNPRGFRRSQAQQLGLGPVARLAWAKERRVCQAVRLHDGERTLIVANLHATSYPPDQRLPDLELERAFCFVAGIADREEPIVVAGDFNVTFEGSRTLLEVASEEWGFSSAGEGIDHVVVRGFTFESGTEPWPRERRERDGARISDHAPVDAVIV